MPPKSPIIPGWCRTSTKFVFLAAWAIWALGSAQPTARTLPRQIPPPNDEFANAIVINSNPFSDSEDTTTATVENTDPPLPSSCADSTGPYNTIWYTFTPAVSGSLIAETFDSNHDTVITGYLEPNQGQRIIVACNDDYNYPSILTSQVVFPVNGGALYSLMVSSYMPGGGALQFRTRFYEPPSNDDFANITAFGGLPYAATGNNFAATKQSTDPIPSCGFNEAPNYTLWYRYRPVMNETVTAETLGSNYDTVLSVYTGTAGSGFTEVACNDDISVEIFQSRLSFAASAGTTYSFMISSSSSLDTGSFAFHVTQPSLMLTKTVTNNNGGVAAATAWTLRATGASSVPTNLSGITPVNSGDGFNPDIYALAETVRAGYQAGAWNCGAAMMPDPTYVVVPPGTIVTCTINNDDIPPVLTLLNTVTKDNGGNANPSDWILTSVGTGGSPTNLSGSTGVTSGASFKADIYILGQSGPPGYVASLYSCIKNGGAPVSANTITLAVGDIATCTVNNNDIAPSLTLVKTVTNDHGGTAEVTAWTLTATGTGASPTNLGGTTPVVSGASFKADTYALAETAGPSGYSPGAWNCGAANMPDAKHVVVPFGGDVTCTINNIDLKKVRGQITSQ